jgi:hypothetical protein
MNPLQRLLSQDDRFFDLLEASAAQVCDCIKALRELVAQLSDAKTVAPFVLARRKAKAITHEIGDLLCTTFVATLERDDIGELSDTLYKIPKTVEKVAERLLLVPELSRGIDFSSQVDMLEKAAKLLLSMVREMRKGAHVERIRALNDELQNIEGDLDELMLEQLRTLYRGGASAGAARLVYLKDLYELLEKVADRCRDAGVVMTHMVLRNT